MPESSAPRKVLVVDDCHDSTEMIGMLLESAGHSVTRAHDGPAALAMYERIAPDIVLLDISLPGMTGQEVCRRMLAAATEKPKAIVAMTGWQRDEVRRSADEAGFTHHLLKPIDPAGLVALIERIGG
jgi:CheY-like chemotaxis protein